jgi:universal stress protein A
MPTITRILVATDFSDAADEALRYATVLAERLGARLSLVHVVDPFAQALSWEGELSLSTEMPAEVVEGIQRQFSRRAPIMGHAVAITSIVTGVTSSAIVDHARDNGIDLIVMGTHGRHGMAHLLLGSVAERVVRTASCPVLTVRGARLAAAPEQCLVETCPA